MLEHHTSLQMVRKLCFSKLLFTMCNILDCKHSRVGELIKKLSSSFWMIHKSSFHIKFKWKRKKRRSISMFIMWCMKMWEDDDDESIAARRYFSVERLACQLTTNAVHWSGSSLRDGRRNSITKFQFISQESLSYQIWKKTSCNLVKLRLNFDIRRTSIVFRIIICNKRIMKVTSNFKAFKIFLMFVSSS